MYARKGTDDDFVEKDLAAVFPERGRPLDAASKQMAAAASSEIRRVNREEIMTSAQLEMAAQAIAKERNCDLSDGCPALDGRCRCEHYARAAIRAAERAALCETPK